MLPRLFSALAQLNSFLFVPTVQAQTGTVDSTFNGFINTSKGLPIADPSQYADQYRGATFSHVTSTRDLFGQLTAFALSFVGMVGIILLIYAGFVYITANGEQSKIDKAKKLIWGTVVGLIIVFAVYATVSSVLGLSNAINTGLRVGPLEVGPGGTTLRF